MFLNIVIVLSNTIACIYSYLIIESLSDHFSLKSEMLNIWG